METAMAILDDFADIEHFLCTAPEVQFQQCAQRCRQLIAQPKERKSPSSQADVTNIPIPPNINELIATGNRALALATIRTYQQRVRATMECEILCERAKLWNEELQKRAKLEHEGFTKEEVSKKKCCTLM